MHQLIPDSAFILVNKSKQPLYSRNSFERGLSKTLKKLTIFFLSNPVPFNGQSYQKQKGNGTSDQLYFKLQYKYIKISLLVMYYLTKVDGINIERCLNYSKNYFMQANSWNKLFDFHLPHKMWKERGKIPKFEYLENEKSFLDGKKKIFHSFSRAIIWRRTNW